VLEFCLELGRDLTHGLHPIEASKDVNRQLFLKADFELDEYFGGRQRIDADVGQRCRRLDAGGIDPAYDGNGFLNLPFHVRHSTPASGTQQANR
jgi:hypothetical protein